MSEEQRLRAALEAAVPDPPRVPGRAREARHLTRQRRRRTALLGAAAVVGLALLVPVARSLDHRSGPDEFTGVVSKGEGPTACRQLNGKGLGTRVDTRTVDGATAAAWLLVTHSPIDPSQVSGARAVTVCVMYQNLRYAVVVTLPGHVALVDTRGDFHAAEAAIDPLDDLWKGGRETTDAPFRCREGSPSATDVSTSLPSGATAARICFDGTMFTPEQTLTTNVDRLVRAIDASPISYVPPNDDCTGNSFSYDYTIAFEYPTGTRTVTYEQCHGLYLGAYLRDASTSLAQRFLEMLQQQVEVTSGPVTPPACPPSGHDAPSGSGDLRRLVAARFCSGGSQGSGQVFSDAQLATLHTWGQQLDQSTTEIESPCPRPAGGWPHLALTDVWSNDFTVTVKCRTSRFLLTVLTQGSTTPSVFPLPADRPLQHLLQSLAGHGR